MGSEPPTTVLLVVSQLAAEAAVGATYAERRASKPHLPAFNRGFWVIGRDGQPEDPLLFRHWALRIRDEYFELERSHQDNGVTIETRPLDDPARLIRQVDMMGYTHYSQEEIRSIGM